MKTTSPFLRCRYRAFAVYSNHTQNNYYAKFVRLALENGDFDAQAF